MASDKLSLMPSVAVLYNYIRLKACVECELSSVE
jgi:hypothetical protein